MSEEGLQVIKKRLAAATPGDEVPKGWKQGQRDAARAVLKAAAPITRGQIAEEIRVEMRRHDNAQTGFSAIGDAYAHAARIAERGGE